MNDSPAIIFLASMMALKDYVSVTRVRTELWILKKVLKFGQQFSRPRKSLKNGDKVWKTVKSLEFFFLQLQKWNLFCFGQILFNLALMFAVHREKNFVPAFF